MNNETNLLLTILFIGTPLFLVPEKYSLIILSIMIPLGLIFSSFLTETYQKKENAI